jgi:hypothetical protein
MELNEGVKMRTPEQIASDIHELFKQHSEGGTCKLYTLNDYLTDPTWKALWREAYYSKQMIKVYKALK